MPDSIELDISHGDSKAVIEGKTSVAFKKFVQLVIQRKVTALFKDWGDTPVIVDSEMLTSLASAPQDSAESHGRLVMVALGIGVLAGVFAFAVIQVALMFSGFVMGIRELWTVIGLLAGLTILVVVLMQLKKKPKNNKIVESVEKVADFLSR